MAGVLAGKQMLGPFPGVCWSHWVWSRRTAGVMAGEFAWGIRVDTMFMVMWTELNQSPGTRGDSP